MTKRLWKGKELIKTIIVIGGDGILHEVLNDLDGIDIPVPFISAI